MSRPEDSPWAVSVAQVSTRAGQSTRVDRDFPAPEGIGDQVVGIPAGTPVHVEGDIDSLVDGLLLQAHISVPLNTECTRCLRPVNASIQDDPVVFFPYKEPEPEPTHGKEEILAEQEEASGQTYPLVSGGAFMDLEALLRDTLVEALPLQPLCRPDCRGLCPQCGMDLNDHPDHHHEIMDDRWAALEGLKQRLEQEENPGSAGQAGE
ncbi:YceD family protein [Bifidobacterium asteroides]|uniref:DNA-binding protein n=1 Tax=Bifidobacterium asteroides TaxID=1684 RepID=A0A318MLQ8_9BIFI|nr:DUF177 domain-containing protein [Bifidobacterium asteroides]PXY89549.1 DNA-binding protein [Bifidobacterium asteroides]